MKIINDCITVTGTIYSVKGQKEDGDLHTCEWMSILSLPTCSGHSFCFFPLRRAPHKLLTDLPSEVLLDSFHIAAS